VERARKYCFGGAKPREKRPRHTGSAFFAPPISLPYPASLAQSVERKTLNLVVVGSSPTGGGNTFCTFALSPPLPPLQPPWAQPPPHPSPASSHVQSAAWRGGGRGRGGEGEGAGWGGGGGCMAAGGGGGELTDGATAPQLPCTLLLSLAPPAGVPYSCRLHMGEGLGGGGWRAAPTPSHRPQPLHPAPSPPRPLPPPPPSCRLHMGGGRGGVVWALGPGWLEGW
jgi:hypothetical protein